MSKKLKIIPLGGCGEVGKNMTVLEYDDEIVVIDAGIMFPQNDMLGVDSIIPDYNYLKDKMDKVVAVLITHGHEDHIGAVGHFMRDCEAPLYATPLTAGFLRGKLREAKLSGQRRIETIQAGDEFKVGKHFTVEPFHVTHSIPDCVGFGITTPVGLVVHTGDYKFDHTPVDGWPPDFAKLAEFSSRGVLCLLADSTNATVPGWTQSEQALTSALNEVFENAPGRIIVASFASLISRIWMVAEAAIKHDRKLALAGRSMRENVKVAQQLGYLDLPDDLLIELSSANSMPADRVVVMATGSQGEPTSVLGRLSRGRHHQLTIKDHDTIVISAHTIPGNEEMIYRIINNLIRQGAHVLYEENSNLHVSGHASQEEMKLMINLVDPHFFIPVHGELRMLKEHGQLGERMGIEPERIAVIENGTPVELDQNEMIIHERLRGGYVFVQGGSAGDVGFPDIRDREKLAQAGFFAASLFLDKDANLISKPQYASEGFMKMKGAEDLLEGVEKTIRDAAQAHQADRKQLDAHIAGALRRYFFSETGLRPMTYVMIHNK